jgi:hypothetical protein
MLRFLNFRSLFCERKLEISLARGVSQASTRSKHCGHPVTNLSFVFLSFVDLDLS